MCKGRPGDAGLFRGLSPAPTEAIGQRRKKCCLSDTDEYWDSVNISKKLQTIRLISKTHKKGQKPLAFLLKKGIFEANSSYSVSFPFLGIDILGKSSYFTITPNLSFKRRIS
jgi:hypothetical protein